MEPVLWSAPPGMARTHGVLRGLLETRVMGHALVGAVMWFPRRGARPSSTCMPIAPIMVLWSPQAHEVVVAQPRDAHRVPRAAAKEEKKKTN